MYTDIRYQEAAEKHLKHAVRRRTRLRGATGTNQYTADKSGPSWQGNWFETRPDISRLHIREEQIEPLTKRHRTRSRTGPC